MKLKFEERFTTKNTFEWWKKVKKSCNVQRAWNSEELKTTKKKKKTTKRRRISASIVKDRQKHFSWNLRKLRKRLTWGKVEGDVETSTRPSLVRIRRVVQLYKWASMPSTRDKTYNVNELSRTPRSGRENIQAILLLSLSFVSFRASSAREKTYKPHFSLCFSLRCSFNGGEYSFQKQILKLYSTVNVQSWFWSH